MIFVVFLIVLMLMSVVVGHDLYICTKKQDFINLFFVVLQSGLMIAYIFIWCLKNVAVG